MTILDLAVDKMTRWGVISGMAVLFVLLMMRVIARATEIAFTAYDEIGELATIWMILLGVLALWRKGMLYRVDMLVLGKAAWKGWMEALVQIVSLSFAAVMVIWGWDYAANSREVTAFMQINKIWYYGALPFCCAIMGVYSFVHLARTVRDNLARGADDKRARSEVAEMGETAIKHL